MKTNSNRYISLFCRYIYRTIRHLGYYELKQQALLHTIRTIQFYIKNVPQVNYQRITICYLEELKEDY